MDLNCRFRRDEEVAHHQVDAEYLLVPVRNSVNQKLEIFSLNRIGAFIWAALESPASVADIRSRLVQAYDVEPAQAERDLVPFLEQLLSRGLIRAVED